MNDDHAHKTGQSASGSACGLFLLHGLFGFEGRKIMPEWIEKIERLVNAFLDILQKAIDAIKNL